MYPTAHWLREASRSELSADFRLSTGLKQSIWALSAVV